MKCRPCDLTMEPRAGRYACPCCGRAVTLRDPAIEPALPPQPPVLRVEERGWEQASEPVVIVLEETAREKAQRERREREAASGVDTAAVLANANAERVRLRMERERKHADVLNTRAVNAATRARARNGARSGKWYAEQRGAA